LLLPVLGVSILFEIRSYQCDSGMKALPFECVGALELNLLRTGTIGRKG
jgi:hypothetical protein